jgi:hypothetical protein
MGISIKAAAYQMEPLKQDAEFTKVTNKLNWEKEGEKVSPLNDD